MNIPWLEVAVGDGDTVFTLDNHFQYGGLGDSLKKAFMSTDSLHHKRLIKFALEEYPACGTPVEVLAYHKLDGQSLAASIREAI